jgi:nitroreductase
VSLRLELVVARSGANPWHICEAAFPRQGSPSAQLRHLLHYAVVAPSGHNTQPWRFRVTGDGVELFADRTRALPVAVSLLRRFTRSNVQHPTYKALAELGKALKTGFFM